MPLIWHLSSNWRVLAPGYNSGSCSLCFANRLDLYCNETVYSSPRYA